MRNRRQATTTGNNYALLTPSSDRLPEAFGATFGAKLPAAPKTPPDAFAPSPDSHCVSPGQPIFPRLKAEKRTVPLQGVLPYAPVAGRGRGARAPRPAPLLGRLAVADRRADAACERVAGVLIETAGLRGLDAVADAEILE